VRIAMTQGRILPGLGVYFHIVLFVLCWFFWFQLRNFAF